MQVCVYVKACVRAGVLSNRQMAQVPSTPMFEHCSCRCVASLAACVFCCGCVPPCVCVLWQCVILCSDRDWCCGPWWYLRADEPADERLVDPRGNTPDNTPEKRRHFVFYAVFLIRGYCWTESDSQSDSLLPNQRHFNLPEGTLYYLWVCINTTFTCN